MEGKKLFLNKSIFVIFIFGSLMILNLFFVSASVIGCCSLTKEGNFCIDVVEDECDGEWEARRCEDAGEGSDCEMGYVIDAGRLTCEDRVSNIVYEEGGDYDEERYLWSSGSCPSDYEKGCCMISDDRGIWGYNQLQCSENYRRSIDRDKNKEECEKVVEAANWGACIVGNNCIYATEGECEDRNGYFEEGIDCTNDILLLEYGIPPHELTDRIYCGDSPHQIAYRLDSRGERTGEYHTCTPYEEACNSTGNWEDEESRCKSVECELPRVVADQVGFNSLKDGENICYYDGNERGLPGSEEWKISCNYGRLDFGLGENEGERREICVRDDDPTRKRAKLIDNPSRECFAITNKYNNKLNEEIESLISAGDPRDLGERGMVDEERKHIVDKMWIECEEHPGCYPFVMDAGKNNLGAFYDVAYCLPKVPESNPKIGDFFKNMEVPVMFQETWGWTSGERCIGNCKSFDNPEGFVALHNNLCTRIGDFGTSKNYNGTFSNSYNYEPSRPVSPGPGLKRFTKSTREGPISNVIKFILGAGRTWVITEPALYRSKTLYEGTGEEVYNLIYEDILDNYTKRGEGGEITRYYNIPFDRYREIIEEHARGESIPFRDVWNLLAIADHIDCTTLQWDDAEPCEIFSRLNLIEKGMYRPGYENNDIWMKEKNLIEDLGVRFGRETLEDDDELKLITKDPVITEDGDVTRREIYTYNMGYLGGIKSNDELGEYFQRYVRSHNQEETTTHKKVSARMVFAEFECRDWRRPKNVSSEICESCGEDGVLCTEYKCESLGENCIMWEGEEGCYAKPDRMTPPEVRKINYIDTRFKFDKDDGFNVSIERDEGERNCLFYASNLEFEIEFDRPVTCVFDEYWWRYPTDQDSDASLIDRIQEFDRQISEIFGGIHFEEDDFVEGEKRFQKNLSFFVACADSNNRRNQEPWKIDFCVESRSAEKAPELIEFVSEYGEEIPFNPESFRLTMHLEGLLSRPEMAVMRPDPREIDELSDEERQNLTRDLLAIGCDLEEDEEGCDEELMDEILEEYGLEESIMGKCEYSYDENEWEEINCVERGGRTICYMDVEVQNEGENTVYVRCEDALENTMSERYEYGIIEDISMEDWIARNGLVIENIRLELEGEGYGMKDEEVVEFKDWGTEMEFEAMARLETNNLEPEIEVEVDTAAGADEGNADCEIIVNDHSSPFTKTGGERHEVTTSYEIEPAREEIEYTLKIRCEDKFGISVLGKVDFKIYADDEHPEIEDWWIDGDYIYIELDKPATECRYHFGGHVILDVDEGGNFGQYDEEGLVFRVEGDPGESYYVECKDRFGNEGQSVKSPIGAEEVYPVVTRISKSANDLVIRTNKNSVCYYGYHEGICGYEEERMEELDDMGSLSKEHFITWSPGRTHYIRCEDAWGNLDPGCSAVVYPVAFR